MGSVYFTVSQSIAGVSLSLWNANQQVATRAFITTVTSAPIIPTSAIGMEVHIIGVVSGPTLSQYPLPQNPPSSQSSQLNSNRMLQQQQPLPQQAGIPSLLVNYTVTLSSVSLYSATARSLQNSIMYSTLFGITLTQNIVQQAGQSCPLLTSQIVSTYVVIGPPLSVLKRPTMKPTKSHAQVVPLDELTPFDLTGKVPADYVAQKTKKYFFAYVIMFIGISAVLCVCRLLYLAHLHLNKPSTLCASAAGSSIYDPSEAPRKSDTER
jgi:hypothetical protein